ncbi:uncharacterized protein LOC125858758 [Solanum stenotomum]|uniref:uncharacterized protein LOC125858758 n=1 Tax=Solanum stenotomum TaxID=172797 RepID=UPI0020D17019|nr:uncharacterized protein LOC125858758 [Solanum stenotomum]
MAESNPTESALLASKICNQISSVFSTKSPNPAALDVLVQEIADAANRNGRVFIYGVGRERLMLKALSMRLFHLGLLADCVFDMNTPPIGPSDLLISSAGPGSPLQTEFAASLIVGSCSNLNWEFSASGS